MSKDFYNDLFTNFSMDRSKSKLERKFTLKESAKANKIVGILNDMLVKNDILYKYKRPYKIRDVENLMLDIYDYESCDTYMTALELLDRELSFKGYLLGNVH